MTEKEKAAYLITKYGEQCAINIVNEFLNFQEHLFFTEDSLAYKYWVKIKQEITGRQ